RSAGQRPSAAWRRGWRWRAACPIPTPRRASCTCAGACISGKGSRRPPASRWSPRWPSSAGWARADVDLTEQALTTLPGTPPGDSSLQPPAALAPRYGVEAAAPGGARLSRTDRQAWALDRLRADGALSPRAYARALGVSVDTALLDLRELVDRGLVRAEGTTRDRRYVLAGDTQATGDRRQATGASPTRRRDSPNASCRLPAFGESR